LWIPEKSGTFTLVALAGRTHDEAMENSHGLRNFLLVLVGLIVVGGVAWWLISHLITVILYIAVGALVVGGGIYLVGKARRSLTGGGRRSIGR
jgi:hypothetical protein